MKYLKTRILRKMWKDAYMRGEWETCELVESILDGRGEALTPEGHNPWTRLTPKGGSSLQVAKAVGRIIRERRKS